MDTAKSLLLLMAPVITWANLTGLDPNLSKSEIPSGNYTKCNPETYSTVVNAIICVLLAIILIGTAGGNFLVVLAVYLVKKLQTPSNLLIVSLAFSDLLVGLLVMPFSIIDFMTGYWPFNEGICDMYVSFDVLLCTSSILNLCAISIDRYLVITKPLEYAARRTPMLMGILIASAWIISALISIPPNFGWKEAFKKCECSYSTNVGYQIYATVCAFYLPLIIMLVLYGRIFKLAREMSKADAKQQAMAQQDDGLLPDSTRNGSLANDAAVVILNGDDESQLIEKNAASSDRKSSEISLGTRARNKRIKVDKKEKKSKGNSETKAIKTLGVIMGCFCLCWLPFFLVQPSGLSINVPSTSRQIQRTCPSILVEGERRAETEGFSSPPTETWILGQLLSALIEAGNLGKEEDDKIKLYIGKRVHQFLVWLVHRYTEQDSKSPFRVIATGYLNSFLNPIIYAKFNREFRLPFKLILMCQCSNINNRLRSATYANQYGLPSSSHRRKNRRNPRAMQPLTKTNSDNNNAVSS
ncbi:5-hydroxytryptamine receptor 7 [Cichlidogyrus casuarinus]|uniref:5-hydroxytryptamine receptor 7 n=1 Tax=Cichlidogyrus casuarinus TaxID=1844966 RepID=A0ABD2QDH0_9PLAT